MPTAPLKSAAVVCTAAGIALSPFASPASASAHREPPFIRVEGPSQVYDAAYARAKTVVLVNYGLRNTVIDLVVSEFPREAVNRRLGVHVHSRRCGANPDDSGPHYTRPGAAASVRPRNKEVWLDIRVRPGGLGRTQTVVPWRVGKAARSIVIHAKRTNQRTGDAGRRLVCTNVPFGR
ncbi:hypothetical protein ACFY4C_30080 [Actinomadura viridis]|uniref:hypothetical protein n=1 Tax=Actinomadura viridis TaxID=58110 RepID=UPI0036745F4E